MATAVATTTSAAPAKVDRRVTLRNLFEHQRPELTKLLPKGLSLDRLYRLALTECIKNPDLLDCTAESWALAMQVCAKDGLYPDSSRGEMYLIPRQNSKKVGGEWKKVHEVTAMRGYQGDISLVRRSGELLDIYAEVVHEKDTYRVVKGLNRDVVHEPYDGDDDPGPLKAVYAVAKLKSGEVAWVALTKRDVMRHKASAQGTDREDSPWRKHEPAMWKKTAIRELYKWLPKSEQIQDDDEARVDAPAGQVIEAFAVPQEPARTALEAATEQLKTEAPAAPASAPKCETHGEEMVGGECWKCSAIEQERLAAEAKSAPTAEPKPKQRRIE